MSMLCDPADCTLLIIDPQARLMPAIDGADDVIRRCVQLATAARELGVHVIGTEQNPDGLGPLVPEIAGLCDTVLAKFHFSAAAEEGFLSRLPAGRNTLVVAGCEAHVCVLQTALELLEEGKEVYVVADCVGSRRAVDRDTALTRMRDEGVRVVTHEMVVFEWLAVADTPLFRDVNRGMLR